MDALGAYGVQTAQILLSPDDTETRRKHLNARATMGTLLDLGAVPVVNENDTVATAEIRFGDNDRLAARVAAMIGAELLILLSDVDGLYTANPNNSKSAEHLAIIDHINDKIMAMAGTANAQYASGGMITKLEAARISTAAGCHMWQPAAVLIRAASSFVIIPPEAYCAFAVPAIAIILSLMWSIMAKCSADLLLLGLAV